MMMKTKTKKNLKRILRKSKKKTKKKKSLRRILRKLKKMMKKNLRKT